ENKVVFNTVESNTVRRECCASINEELVSDGKKKTVFPTVSKIEFVGRKQPEKRVRKPVKYAEMYMSQRSRGNQRNWNNQKSQQLGSEKSKVKVKPEKSTVKTGADTEEYLMGPPKPI
ncbi:hypothetical protein Tco_0494394, partial [Tanacetum coccineum]